MSKSIDEILDRVLIGMYARDDEGAFVPIDDKYNVLRNKAKQALLEAIKGAKPEYDLVIDGPAERLVKRVLNKYEHNLEELFK